MANFDKKWSELSGDESRAMKEKYGSRSDWQEAKDKAQTQSTQKTESKPAEKTYTAPVTGASADQLARKQAQQAAESKKLEAKQKAETYLANHPNKGKGGTKDAEYDRILKEGGLNNHTFQKMQQAEQKQRYEQAQVDRKKSAQAYSQSRKDIQAEKAKYGPRGVYDRQSALEIQSKDRVGAKYQDQGKDMDAKERDTAALVRTFQNSGHDYTHSELQRSKGQGAYQAQNDYLYDEYGGGKEGWKNWREDHSIYGGENAHNYDDFWNNSNAPAASSTFTYNTGNFKGSKDLMDFDNVMEIGRNQQDAMKKYQSSDEFQNKYGEYSWANNSKYGK
jgi:hypothetical protein